MSTEHRIKQLFSRKTVAPDSILVREVSGEAVLLNLDSGIYLGLDQTGFRMWAVLSTADSIGAAYEQLLSEYEVNPVQLLEDLDRLLDECKEQGILRLEPPE